MKCFLVDAYFVKYYCDYCDIVICGSIKRKYVETLSVT